MDPVSLRPLVVEGVQPFARSFGARQAAAIQVLVEMIVGVSNYSEEGLAFAPVVFVTDDLPAALSSLQGSDPIFVGKESNGTVAARSALRSCAPLGEGRRWGLFVVLEDHEVRFGVFRPEGSPVRPTSFELLRRGGHPHVPVIGITQLRTGVVEIRASTGQGRYFDFTGSPEKAMHPGSVVREFVAAVTSAAPDDVSVQLQAFYYRIGVDILTGDHGALAAVLARDAAPPEFLRDGIWLEPPVELVSWIRRDNLLSTSEGARALFAYAQLIRRMTMMDGITVFGADGTVHAYRCFIREAAGVQFSGYGGGGARRRAYDLLRRHLGSSLIAALYRSQDGAADCATIAGG